MQTKNKGFTLVELLVVISIIAFLSAASFVAYTTIKVKGRDAKRNADTSTIQKALGLYQTRNEKYPLAENGTCLTGADPVSVVLKQDLPQMPTDPTTKADATKTPSSGAIPHCYYYTSADGTAYSLDYYLEGEKVTKTRAP